MELGEKWPEEKVERLFSDQIDLSKLDDEKRSRLENLRREFLIDSIESLKGKAAGVLRSQNRGMINRKNDCYMISVLQCLSNMGALTRAFLRQEWQTRLNPMNRSCKGRMACAYFDFLVGQWTQNGKGPLDPMGVKRIAGQGSKAFSNEDQQDPMEFLSFLLDALHLDLSAPGSDKSEGAGRAEGSEVARLFEGETRSALECPECGRSSWNFEAFTGLGLSLPTPEDIEVEIPVYPLDSSKPALLLRGHLLFGHQLAALENALIPRRTKSRSTYVLMNGPKLLSRLERPMIANLSPSEVKSLAVQEIFEQAFFELVFGSKTKEVISALTNTRSNRVKISGSHKGQPVGIERELSVPESLSCFEIYMLSYLLFRAHLIKGSLSALSRKELLAELKSALKSSTPDPSEASFYLRVNDSDLLELSQTRNLFDETWSNRLNVEVILNPKVNLLPTLPAKTASLSIDPDPPSISLQDCLALSFRDETLDHQNAWFCPTCQEPQKATKKFLISRRPQILILHLKRFHTQNSQEAKKSLLKIDFPIHGLDLKPFLLCRCGERFCNPGGPMG